MTVIGPANTEYLSIINRSKVFEVVPLDAKAATELAFLNRDVFGTRDRKSKAQPYQKVKVDWHILAICRVAECDTLYTDDKSLIGCAKLCGITTVRLVDLPIHSRLAKLRLIWSRTRNCRRSRMTKSTTAAARKHPSLTSSRSASSRPPATECDEDEARWDERLRKVAGQKPAADKPVSP